MEKVVGGSVFVARDVLAGAYRGKAVEDRALLVHWHEREARAAKTLCGRVPEDSLCDEVDTEVDCAVCVKRMATREKRAAAAAAKAAKESA